MLAAHWVSCVNFHAFALSEKLSYLMARHQELLEQRQELLKRQQELVERQQELEQQKWHHLQQRTIYELQRYLFLHRQQEHSQWLASVVSSTENVFAASTAE